MPRRARLNRAFRLLSGYLSISLLNAVSPLLALPSITHTAGARGWAAIAIGQSLGTTAGVLIELGWGISGTQRVARQSRRNIAQTYAAGLSTQAVVAIPLLTAAAVAAYLLAPTENWTAALVAVAAGGSLSAAWVFIGIAKPQRILLQETLPRTVAVGFVAFALLAGAPLITYALALLAVGILCPLLAMRTLGVRAADFRRLSPRRLLFLVRCQGKALTARVFSSVYISFGTTAVTLVAPQATAGFAAIDRLMRMAQQVLGTLQRMLAAWVGRAIGREQRVRRARKALLFNIAGGMVGGLLFAILAPWAADLLFSGVVHVPREYAAIAGGSLGIIFTSMSCGHILLIALNRIDALAWSAVCGAIVGLPSILFGAKLAGVPGALVGQLIAETAVLAVQLAVAIPGQRRVLGAPLPENP